MFSLNLWRKLYFHSLKGLNFFQDSSASFDDDDDEDDLDEKNKKVWLDFVTPFRFRVEKSQLI